MKRLTPSDMYAGDLLPIADRVTEQFLIFYCRDTTQHIGGSFYHFRARCLVAEAASEDEAVGITEMLMDEGGTIAPVRKRRRKKRR